MRTSSSKAAASPRFARSTSSSSVSGRPTTVGSTPQARLTFQVPRAVGINHVAVEVGDLDEALAFLEAIFGEVELRGRSGRMAFVDLGDQFVALAAGATEPTHTRHVGLVVDDREATLAAARAAGA